MRFQGAQSKMAASDTNSCIYLSDTPKQVKNKVSIDLSFLY